MFSVAVVPEFQEYRELINNDFISQFSLISRI